MLKRLLFHYLVFFISAKSISQDSQSQTVLYCIDLTTCQVLKNALDPTALILLIINYHFYIINLPPLGIRFYRHKERAGIACERSIYFKCIDHSVLVIMATYTHNNEFRTHSRRTKDRSMSNRDKGNCGQCGNN